MLTAILLAQFAFTAPKLGEKDSTTLHNRVEQAAFRYMFDWRYLWQKEMRLVMIERTAHPLPSPPNYNRAIQLRPPTGDGCDYEQLLHLDLDRHAWIAHLIRAPNRLKLSLCPMWAPPNWHEPPDERKAIDASLTVEGFPPIASDSARLVRQPIVALLDSAARLLPGDAFIVGQRVRFHLDQADAGGARRAAGECQADFWWCLSLQAYIDFVQGNVTRASATFDRARPLMPDSVRCDWDDASMFFDYTGTVAYRGLSCAQRDSINERTWWLADPLFIEAGNERRTEHYARHVLIELHAALDADERFDWRANYQGPALREMVLRYGWPTEIVTYQVEPMRWATGNTHSTFLGDTTVYLGGYYAAWCGGIGSLTIHGRGCSSTFLFPSVRYWGPQFHTVPLWRTVLDPFHANDDGWDLAPRNDDGTYWDTSWWPLEFYRRDNGPLVPLASQVAFFRRQKTAVLAAAMSWDTVRYLNRPLARMVGAVMISTGPKSPMIGARDTMSGRTPRAMATTVPSGPSLLAIEMVPAGSSGPAARTRFGVTAPAPLAAVQPGDIALSDVVLTTATGGQGPPVTFAAMLPRMIGSAILRNPKTVALFWELYGLPDRDTVAVSIRAIRHQNSNPLEWFGAMFGLGKSGADTVVVQWTEPRPTDPTATIEGGVTIRPRGLSLDVSAFDAGRYTLELQVQRRNGVGAVAKRDFFIER